MCAICSCRPTFTSPGQGGLATRIQFILFVAKRRTIETKLRSFRRMLDPSGVLWVSWPKKTSGVPTDITEDTIRQLALPLGLVDIKVCAVNDIWSGLKLMIRKELR